jgi:hypothetical protein
MKKLMVALLLGGIAGAAPPAPKPGFHAKFCKPHKMVQETEGTAYGWESATGGPIEGEMVYEMTGKNRKTLAALQKLMRKTLDRNAVVSEDKPILMGKNPGREWSGINERGVPFTLRMVSLPTRSYVWGASTYDTAHNRDFVQTFRVLP